MRTKVLTGEGHHRMFRAAVWIGRCLGWMLLVLVIFGVAQAMFLPAIMGGFKLLPALILVLLAVAWIAGLELFLRFFDHYLSGN